LGLSKSKMSARSCCGPEDEFEKEVEWNVIELREGGYVTSIDIVERFGTSKVRYRIKLLEEQTIVMVDFERGLGYFVKESGEHFETMQALLSKLSPSYREVFAANVSRLLLEKMSKTLS